MENVKKPYTVYMLIYTVIQFFFFSLLLYNFLFALRYILITKFVYLMLRTLQLVKQKSSRFENQFYKQFVLQGFSSLLKNTQESNLQLTLDLKMKSDSFSICSGLFLSNRECDNGTRETEMSSSITRNL